MPTPRQRDGLTEATAYREGDLSPYAIIGGRRYAVCEDCSNIQLWGNMEGWKCRDCANNSEDSEDDYDSEHISIPERLYDASNNEKFQSLEAGKIITSKRIFSAEIECYVQTRSAMSEARHTLPREIGISSDGSLNNNGVEFQTPKLKGKHGEQTIKELCKVLNANTFKVDRSTGLHIHLDGRGLLPSTLTTQDPVALKQLWQFYLAFDEVMLSFLPISRRTNRYCKSMTSRASYAQIQQAKHQRDIEVLWYHNHNVSDLNYNKSHKYHDSKYHGINLHILLAEKHLEVRFHAGTLNSTKILEWTAMHQRICDMAAAGQLITSEAMMSLPLATKTKMFFSILGLPLRAQKYFERRQEQFVKDCGESAVESKEVTA